MVKPTIGVSVSARSGWRIFPLIALNVRLAGGHPVRWQAGQTAELSEVHGVIIGGGDDISPDLYGGKLVKTARLDPARDELERCLAEEGRKRNLPTMGICRGSQMLNVAFGGTLDQDAYATFSESRKYRTILPRKSVFVEVETRLATITGTDEMLVNALHSQSVDTLGDGFRIAARDDGGMVQAIERVEEPFAIGVQWHPEHLFYARRQRALFRALVAAARARAEKTSQIEAVAAEADHEKTARD